MFLPIFYTYTTDGPDYLYPAWVEYMLVASMVITAAGLIFTAFSMILESIFENRDFYKLLQIGLCVALFGAILLLASTVSMVFTAIPAE